jgi:glycosyltransferase involved in cell wall biosynthesis
MAAGDMTEPLVSIIIPAYNSEKYIADTLRSVITQTYANIEVIVVDDASTDATLQVVEGMNIKRPISIIKKEKNSGAAASRNMGYKQSEGSLVKFLDADDLIGPEMIANQVALVENDSCIVSAQWGRFKINDISTFKLNPEECWQTMPSLEWICSSWKNTQPMTNPGIFLIPKKLIEKAGLWDENLSLLDDTEYFTRTILCAEKVIFSSTSTLYYRSGINGLSTLNTRKGIESAYMATEKAANALINKQDDDRTRLLCANLWQSFVHWIYPAQDDLITKAEQKIKNYGGSSLKFKSGGYSKILQSVVGWRLMKKIKFWYR